MIETINKQKQLEAFDNFAKSLPACELSDILLDIQAEIGRQIACDLCYIDSRELRAITRERKAEIDAMEANAKQVKTDLEKLEKQKRMIHAEIVDAKNELSTYVDRLTDALTSARRQLK